MEERQFIAGMYRHFKGQLCEALFLASDSEDPNKKIVVYRHDDTGEMWVRPLGMFMENVERPEYSGPRFTYLGPKA